jgi:hypothetical protein
MTDQDRDAASYVEEYIAANRITKITMMPATTLDGIAFPKAVSAVIGNDKYFGSSLADCVAQSVGRV